MSILALVTQFLLSSPSFATDRVQALMTCAQALHSTSGAILRPGPDAAVIPAYADGWSLLVFDRTMSYRCVIPTAIEACFRANPKCPAFDFLIAHPGHGIFVTFSGVAIDDQARLARLGTFKPLARGTIDESGRIAKVIRAGVNPILGLKCVADRGPATVTAFERALAFEIAAAARPVPAACASLAPTVPETIVPPNQETPASR